MKRILLRMSALATVVALGLGIIAIAQAQRGDESPAASRKPDDSPSQPVEPATNLPRIFGARNPLRQAGLKTQSQGTAAEAPLASGSSALPPARSPLLGDDSSILPPRSTSPPLSPPADPFPQMPKTGSDGARGEPGPTTGDADATSKSLADASSSVAAGESDPFPAQIPVQIRPPGGTRPMLTAEADGRANPSEVVPGSDTRVESPPRMLIDSIPRSLPEGSFANSQPFPQGSLRAPVGTGSVGMSSPVGLPLAEGSGSPGDRQLEGPQTPQMTVEKIAPKEIRIGKPATFVVKIRNTGRVVAGDVEIRDRIPSGTQLQSTNPAASRGPQGELTWKLGSVDPNEEASVEVVLMPIKEGEIGSVATVHFNAAASARTMVTKPQLVLQTTVPEKVLIGDEVPISITISNPGSGVATGVILLEHIPAGLEHPAGPELEYEVGDLAPKESRQLPLVLRAVQPGAIANLVTARDDAGLVVEDSQEIEVIAPRLSAALNGPRRRYLGRPALHTLTVKNPGSAPARHVELVARLPGGLSFVSANNNGSYDETTGTVRWNLEELPVEETAQVELATMPVEAGEQMILFRTSDESGLSAQIEHAVLVEGIAAIFFEVADVADPIEVGEQTTYEVKVVNQGSKVATNVRLAAYLPGEMQFVGAEGPVRHADSQGRVIFEPLPRLAPKADTTYHIRVKGVDPGDLRFRVELSTDEIIQPVKKEESTRVYADE